MNKKASSRPVFPFTSIVGQAEICGLKVKIYAKAAKSNILQAIQSRLI